MSSILSGLFSGRSGIQAHGTAISVIADNIANQNTVGFKTGRADFVDLLAGSLNGGSGALSTGSGSAVKKVTRVLTQGTFEFTGRGLDLAIDGNGFLMVQDRAGVTYYTRAGNLAVDSDGNLLDQNGFSVLGYASDGSGALTKLNVTDRVANDIGTNNVAVTGNLDARIDPTGGAIGPSVTYANLDNTDAFSTSVNVFDSLGGTHNVRVSFFKTAAQTWEAGVYIDGSEVTTPGSVDGEAFQVGAPIPLVFNANGQLTVPANAIANIGPFDWANGAAASNIEIDLSRFSQFATNSSLESLSQDGTGSGSVVGYSVTSTGDLVAQLSNGQTATIGTIALANFANNEGLQRVGNSLFAASKDSGEPIVGVPGVGTFGLIESGALELSTADMAADFIKLISLQRGFQGSSRIIGSISDLLNEVVNLAR